MSLLSIPSDLVATRDIRPWLEGLDISMFDISKIEIVLVELGNNIIQHGYGQRKGEVRFEFRASADGSGYFLVSDDAPEVSIPGESDLPEVPQVRGYGLHIITQLTRSFEHEYSEGSNMWTLEFIRTKSGSTSAELQATIRPEKRLDVVSAPDLRKKIGDLLSDKTPTITVDLSEVEYCDSAALAALIAGMKKARGLGGDLLVVRPRASSVWEIFELTQFDRVFTFVEAVK